MNLNLLKNIFNKWHVNIITDNITDIQSILKFATCIYIQQMMLKQNNAEFYCSSEWKWVAIGNFLIDTRKPKITPK